MSNSNEYNHMEYANGRIKLLAADAISLLRSLIRIPSFSREESGTADLLAAYFQKHNIPAHRYLNNVWAVNKYFDKLKPTLLLNSHHDTVRPNPQYTKDPFQPVIEDGKLYGLGSNDAGGPLVSLIASFIYFYNEEDLPWNIVIAATAEEEISGKNGIEALLNEENFLSITGALDNSFQNWSAIVGEPTKMELAVAEKGLLVLDCIAHGKAGHAAREEGINAIYLAMDAIHWFRNYRFPKESGTLGSVKMNVTVINTENNAHNVVPANCRFTVDIRVTDAYTHEELLEIIEASVSCEVRPRSMRLRATAIPLDHPLVVSAIEMGKGYYGSPTSSDKALIPFAALKMGPGESARSHSADEYIYLREIEEGIEDYTRLIETTFKKVQ